MATQDQTPEHYTNIFCWRRGFKAQDLGQHPCADDLVLLSLIKTDLGSYLTDSDHAKINGLWGMVYTRRFPLKNKHHRDLEDITTRAHQAITRQNQIKQKIQKQRQRV